MLSDPLANALTSIRNAYMRRLEYASIKGASKHILAVLDVLKQQHCIGTVTQNTEGNKTLAKVELLYARGNMPVLNCIKRVSKVSGRIYKNVSEIKRLVQRNQEKIYVISTNKGLLTSAQAIEQNLGGEVLFFATKVNQ